MRNPRPDRLVFKVELIFAAPIEGTDKLMVTLRTDAIRPLEVRLTRPEAADLVRLMSAEGMRAPSTISDGAAINLDHAGPWLPDRESAE